MTAEGRRSSLGLGVISPVVRADGAERADVQIIDCEILKDKKSGDSLQYAFIGFETKEQAEAAYFKMVCAARRPAGDFFPHEGVGDGDARGDADSKDSYGF